MCCFSTNKQHCSLYHCSPLWHALSQHTPHITLGFISPGDGRYYCTGYFARSLRYHMGYRSGKFAIKYRRGGMRYRRGAALSHVGLRYRTSQGRCVVARWAAILYRRGVAISRGGCEDDRITACSNVGTRRVLSSGRPRLGRAGARECLNSAPTGLCPPGVYKTLDSVPQPVSNVPTSPT